jgi:DNA-binding response OmpR family regulator
MSMPPAQATEQHRRVLVVDGDDATRADFAAALRAAGYEVAEAWSVVQAMRLLLSHRPDAVLLDMILPDGHGFEIGRAMRAIVTTARICVVAVTSSPSALTLMDPASFGARAILLKPLATADLLAAIGECFPQDEATTGSPAHPQPIGDPV